MICTASLVFQVFTARESLPLSGASVEILNLETQEVRTLTTDASGKTPLICLPAPDVALSLSPNAPVNPYARYNAHIRIEGYIPEFIEGIQLFPGIESILPVDLEPIAKGQTASGENEILIPPNALQQRREGTPIGPADPGPRNLPAAIPAIQVLSGVYIPEYIIVHLGVPSNASAENVTVSFPNYIKNVASSEIYPTWPENALRANIHAQISFALNRIYTEWYPSQGYRFDITNSTSYDQYFVKGRNIYANISRIVDDIFNEYLRRPGTANPYFAEYCDGNQVTCRGLSQWGTVSLANQGLTPLQILRRYYGTNLEIVSTDRIQAVQSSYPGTALRLGSSSAAVRVIKNFLNRIRQNYPAIPRITQLNGDFDAQTEAAVTAFQRIFNLTPDGIVGRATWNRISYIYTAVTQLASLDSQNIPIPSSIPAATLRRGSTGSTVRLAQFMLQTISEYYSSVRPVSIDGTFGSQTQAAVIDFQRQFGLTADGIIGPNTWSRMFDVFLGAARSAGLVTAYPGTPLREGSTGDDVWLMQSYLNTISRQYPIPEITPDGIYGPDTEAAVIAIQRIAGLTPDGIIGPDTWQLISGLRLLV